MKTPATEPVLPSRLMPQISFRFLLAVTALGAVVAALARAAGGGGAFAVAMITAIGFVAGSFVLFAVLFLMAYGFARLRGRTTYNDAAGSPFSEGQLPPQILPPRDIRS